MSLRTVITNDDYERNSCAKQIVEYLVENSELLNLSGGTLYYKYPKYNSGDFPIVPDIFIVSPFHGIIVINSSEKSPRELTNKYLENFFEDLDDLVGLITSQFIKIKALRKSRREIAVSINTIAFFPNCEKDDFPDEDEIFSIVSPTDLVSIFSEMNLSRPLSEDTLKDIYSVIDGSRSIPNDNVRNISEEDTTSKGAVLSELDKQIATFDYKQKLAALTIVDGPQRIRGMAGSGKTVVLAMKAAQLHINNPNDKILYTFYTKSLYDQIKRLITRFYRMTQDHDPNWDNLQIFHAWGGQNQPGVYYNTCVNNDERPLSYNEASKSSSLVDMKPFEYICYEFLKRKNQSIKKEFDYILIDEGQDFPNSFYWLCRRLVRSDRIIWAYDELQNILDVEPQDSKKLFKNNFGDEGIDLEELLKNHPQQSNDIILQKSYRNPKEILVSAHSLGFGIYNDRVIQMLENREHWQDLGYVVERGGEVGEDTVIERPIKNSPSLISQKFEKDEIINLKSFDSMYSEMDYVAEQIRQDIENKLNPEDILVICLDDRYNRKYYEDLSFKLSEEEISLNNIMISSTGDQFTIKDHVTFSTVYRAKGNEAGRVYIIGADSLKNKNSVKTRNKIFTALTRSKAWVTITGFNIHDGFIDEELRQVKENDFKMIFKYPSQSEIDYIVQRELAEENSFLNARREKFLRMMEENDFTVAEVAEFLYDDGKKND